MGRLFVGIIFVSFHSWIIIETEVGKQKKHACINQWMNELSMPDWVSRLLWSSRWHFQLLTWIAPLRHYKKYRIKSIVQVSYRWLSNDTG